jgi:DNA-binding NarL/FixJ family response regulator/signal transduction histidine kinase
MLGYPVSALLADPLLLGEHLAPNEIAAAHERQAALLRGDVVPQYVYRVIDAFGRERWIEQSNTAVYRGERVIALEGVLRDVTIQQEAEHRLREQQRELAALQERERISRDLHDGLGQVMGYVNLQAQTAGALAATGQTAAAQAILTQLVQVAQSSHTDIRRYILDLRAPDAPNAAEPWLTQLRRQIAQFEQLYGLRVQLSGTPILEDAPFGAPIGHEVVQIVLEALNNVKKHAGVNAAHVTVQQTADQLTLIVADQGAGFAPKAAAHDRTAGPSGLGMRMMTERAALIHADLQFESAPGRGTQVVLRVPLYAPVEPAAVQQAEPIDMSRLRILLVDDHPLFRAGMRNLLALHGIQVIGEAEDGLQAQALAHALRPDMILMDMHMPHCNGVAATAAIKAQLPDTRIIMLTVAAEEENLFQALQAGASGYLLKNLDSSAFFQLLAEAMRGEVVLSQGLATQTLTALTQAPPPASAAAATRLAFLTARQREILELAAQGRTYKQIAADLFISEASVKYHMGQAIALLQVANRREALALLRQS